MVLFRVTENINIKTTDGTLVNYAKLRNPSQLINNALYITTYDDKQKLDSVFKKVGDNYKTKVLLESKVNSLKTFPKELGVSNKYEYKNILNFEESYFSEYNSYKEQNQRFFLNEEFVSLDTQLEDLKCEEKDEISVVVLGNLGSNIGETIAGLSALRIFHEELSKKYKSVQLDIYIEASENTFFTRDRDVLRTQKYINNIYPLSISVKKFCQYDFYIDNSSVKNRYFYQELNYVDSFLYKFGIDYKKIADDRKHNSLDISTLKIRNDLINKLQVLKEKGKLLLFHPYASENSRSCPKEIAAKILKKLIEKYEDYTIVTALNIDDIKSPNYVNLTAYSKNINDFIFIVSSMDKVITTDTSTYHISDAFFIPTVVLFTTVDAQKRVKYYKWVKAIQIKDKSMNFSHFKFDTENLVLYKYESWKNLKTNEVIELLETI